MYMCVYTCGYMSMCASVDLWCMHTYICADVLIHVYMRKPEHSIGYLPLSSSYFKGYFLFYMYECFACVYVCVPLGCTVRGDQEKVLYALKSELRMAVSHHVASGL